MIINIKKYHLLNLILHFSLKFHIPLYLLQFHLGIIPLDTY